MAKAKTTYSADPTFQKYYSEILAGMNTPTIDYTAPTADEIAEQISAYLRPAVDQQIENRKLATAQQRAQTDADAASRGILESTWVTDIKNRLKQSEAADIAAAESDYRAQLLQGVYNRQAQEADRANQIAIFNAQMRQQAEADAYKRAGDMYSLYLTKQKGRGGSSGGTSGDNSDGYDDDYTHFLGAMAALKKGVGNLAKNPLKPAVVSRPGMLWGSTGGLNRR